jgi:acyl dehydratase
MTLTAGAAAVHQSILGDRLRLSLDEELAAQMSRRAALLAHPALVWNVAIGQSTSATQNVVANLFYRGLAFQRAPAIGDTLHTLTEVVGLRQNTARPGRPATGLAALEIVTLDQHGRLVLNFWRCAMLPLRDGEVQTGRSDDLDAISAELDHAALVGAVGGWDLAAMRDGVPGPHAEELAEGTVWVIEGGDVVSAAPELARLSLNIAMAHHDARSGAGRRLVYGGHTIGIAAAQATRALPNLATIVAWHGCDHVGPVFEGDTLTSELELERVEPLAPGGALLHLRSRVAAHRDGEPVDVLDWRFVGAMA